jgi:hypothetical protein
MEIIVTTGDDDIVEEVSNEPGGQEAEDELMRGFKRLAVAVTELDQS